MNVTKHFICIYMVEFLICGSNINVVNIGKSLLSANFNMKNLEEASVILSIKITWFRSEISLNQSHYIKKILKTI